MYAGQTFIRLEIFAVVFVVTKCQGRRAIQTMLGWDYALEIVDEG